MGLNINIERALLLDGEFSSQSHSHSWVSTDADEKTADEMMICINCQLKVIGNNIGESTVIFMPTNS
jgi:hypothetical protein